jgi:hypothetical protein
MTRPRPGTSPEACIQGTQHSWVLSMQLLLCRTAPAGTILTDNMCDMCVVTVHKLTNASIALEMNWWLRSPSSACRLFSASLLGLQTNNSHGQTHITRRRSFSIDQLSMAAAHQSCGRGLDPHLGYALCRAARMVVVSLGGTAFRSTSTKYRGAAGTRTCAVLELLECDC